MTSRTPATYIGMRLDAWTTPSSARSLGPTLLPDEPRLGRCGQAAFAALLGRASIPRTQIRDLAVLAERTQPRPDFMISLTNMNQPRKYTMRARAEAATATRER